MAPILTRKLIRFQLTARRGRQRYIGPVQAHAVDGDGDGSRAAELGIGHDAGHDGGDGHIDERADDQGSQDADRHVLGRVLGLGRSGRDRLEADVGEEDDRRPPHDAVIAVATGYGRVGGGDERVPVVGVHIGDADPDEGQQHRDLDDDDDVVHVRRLTDTQHQQAAHGSDADGGHQVEGAGRSQGRAVLGADGLDHRGGPHGTLLTGVLDGREQGLGQAEIAHDRHDITGPANGDGRSGDAVFQDKQPAHDPGEDLTQGPVGIGVGRARHRHGRSQFGVAQTRQRDGDAGGDEGQHDRRAGIVGGDLAGQHENTGTDNGTDTQAHEVDGTQGPFQLALGGFFLDLGYGFLEEQAVPLRPEAFCGH